MREHFFCVFFYFYFQHAACFFYKKCGNMPERQLMASLDNNLCASNLSFVGTWDTLGSKCSVFPFICFFRFLDQYQSCIHTNSVPNTKTANANCVVAEMEEEVQALERKLFLEEIAVNIKDERCNFLDRNVRLVSFMCLLTDLSFHFKRHTLAYDNLRRNKTMR